MNKVSGILSDFHYISEDENRVIIGYGLTQVTEEMYEWYEVYFYKIQMPPISLNTIKKAITNDINEWTKYYITNGFPYTIKHGAQQGTEVSVWLSEENQENFHAIHQSAEGITFPVHYKVGENIVREEQEGIMIEEIIPIYEDFANGEEMHQICIITTNHVLQCLNNGWSQKDSIDWTPYEDALNEQLNHD